MPGRSYSAGNQYRYGFNGKENDSEVKGEGNQQDYGMRIYDPRLGRFLSVDPLTKKYAMLTPYQFASNSPVASIDLDGLEGFVATGMSQPFSKDSRPTGMILTVPEAGKVIQGAVTTAFKAAFSEQLPKKLIDHYAHGKGMPYALNKTETVALNVYKTGLHGGSENDIKKATDFLATIKKGESKALPEGYSIAGGTGLAGTLGRFKIELQGEVTKDIKDEHKWAFKGKMRFVDIYDFITGPTQPGDLERNDWGDYQTDFANKYLPGTPFQITSEWIDVKQTNADYFDWFTGKSDKDVPNRLGGPNSKETKEVKKTGTSTGEVNKEKKKG